MTKTNRRIRMITKCYRNKAYADWQYENMLNEIGRAHTEELKNAPLVVEDPFDYEF